MSPAGPAALEDADRVARGAVRLATRRSALALAQSHRLGDAIAASSGRPLALIEVTTRGDVDPSPLTQIGGAGVFVAAVREALLRGEADLAVHSLKDLPTAPAAGLELACVPEREDPRDALVSRDGAGLTALRPGARVGTGSPRRRAQLLAARPDLRVVDLRGNVDTRLKRTLGGADAPGDLDAVVLAVAGLVRLGRSEVISERLDPAIMTPAPGQGALAVERPTGIDDPGLGAALAGLEDEPSRTAVTAERALLGAIGAGCAAPVGALAHVDSGVDGTPALHLHAVVATTEGVLVRRTGSASPHRAVELGRQLAEELLIEAADVARQIRGAAGPTTRGSHL